MQEVQSGATFAPLQHTETHVLNFNFNSKFLPVTPLPQLRIPVDRLGKTRDCGVVEKVPLSAVPHSYTSVILITTTIPCKEMGKILLPLFPELRYLFSIVIIIPKA